MFQCSHITLKKRNLLIDICMLISPWVAQATEHLGCLGRSGAHISNCDSLQSADSHLRTLQVPSHFSAAWEAAVLVPKLSNDFCKSPQQIGLLFSEAHVIL